MLGFAALAVALGFTIAATCIIMKKVRLAAPGAPCNQAARSHSAPERRVRKLRVLVLLRVPHSRSDDAARRACQPSRRLLALLAHRPMTLLPRGQLRTRRRCGFNIQSVLAGSWRHAVTSIGGPEHSRRAAGQYLLSLLSLWA